MNSNFDPLQARAEAVRAEVPRFASKAEALSFICEFVEAENRESSGLTGAQAARRRLAVTGLAAVVGSALLAHLSPARCKAQAQPPWAVREFALGARHGRECGV